MATNVLEFRRSDRSGVLAQEGGTTAVRTKADILPAATLLAHRVENYGLRMMVWHDLATLEPLTDTECRPINEVAFGWTAPELAAWHNPDKAFRSPLVRAARVAGEPLLVTPHAISARNPNPLLDQIDLDDLGACPLARSAIVIPVHMPLGQVGAALLVAASEGRDDLGHAFGLYAAPLADRIGRFVAECAAACRDERYLPENSLLTTREIECLSWVAHGKTDYEISIILGCSHAGVRYHVTRACAKLGAVNRAQSVFRAAQLGYLGVPLAPANGRYAS